MPELPEVETTVKGLNSRVLKRALVDVWSDWEKTIKKPENFKVFKKEIKGKKILKIWRRAKNVIFDLSGGYSLLVHQKMTGHLMVGQWKRVRNKWLPVKKGPLEEKINTFLHVIFFLDSGKMIALSDVRKFAKVELWETEGLLNSKEFKRIGPEPLDKNFTFDKFKSRLEGKRGKIKQVLMNQEAIAGVGNIYASEILWWAKIHPMRNCQSLKEKELENIYKHTKNVLRIGVKLGGESFADYRNVEGKKGNFDDERKVYKREGEKCFRCKRPIKRLKFGGRSAFFCPHCQKS
ncbi:MAG: bifunctional DNA-formamidopyrimidine glycosylase/DNA-(apurinic or apyrimidinic site) lyase [Candidatus Staskawiczbacteria bacterium]|nr:bifunctional DNA-formamidopyrimidine glycosylase/DNA-(apurinic or apyrimidinic site) lyase [Candidatus Staskawiczbacteria bacterium]